MNNSLSDIERCPVIILTGLSGAGKSTALKVFEDVGFFCVDGLPCSMVVRLVKLFQNENPISYRGLALGMDIRQHGFLQEWRDTFSWLEKENCRPHVIFLEAAFDTLYKRYATTRRPHPLESKDINLEQALEIEQELLAPLKKDGELVIDTTDYSVHDLRRHLQENLNFLTDVTQGLRIHILSFGYKYGVPREADLMFDLRFLPNPYFDPELQPFSGQDAKVRDYVLGGDLGETFQSRLLDFLLYLLPLYIKEGRYRLTMALGCTGGRHRSVAVAEAVAESLRLEGKQVSVEHRHLDLG